MALFYVNGNGPFFNTILVMFLVLLGKLFKKNFFENLSLFMEPLIPLFWTSSDVSSTFQSHSGSPHLYTLSALLKRFHRVTIGVTPANLCFLKHIVVHFLQKHLGTQTWNCVIDMLPNDLGENSCHA